MGGGGGGDVWRCRWLGVCVCVCVCMRVGAWVLSYLHRTKNQFDTHTDKPPESGYQCTATPLIDPPAGPLTTAMPTPIRQIRLSREGQSPAGVFSGLHHQCNNTGVK